MQENYLPSEFQKFIHLSKYSRWDYDKKRRETWPETVERYITFFVEHLKERCNYTLTDEEIEKIRNGILNLEVMPSMRCLMTAGPALKRDELSGYNCSYIAINHWRAFGELFFVLLNGVGAGFSVEQKHIKNLPTIDEQFHSTDTTIIVADSKLGWAKSIKEIISLLYAAQIPKWDLSKIRPAGSVLKVFGGRASGPKVLDELFQFLVNIFKNAAGRKLTSLECHDICCKIASCVVAGGCRRSATISLSDLSDDRMRSAKSGQWWESFGYRALANNSVSYEEKPEIGTFMKEWISLYESKSGERGIFNRAGAKKHISKYETRDSNHDWGINPCVVGNTKVSTTSGSIEIQKIVEEMKNGKSFTALTYNTETKEVEQSKITNAFLTKFSESLVKVYVTNERDKIFENDDEIYTILELTPEHRIFTTNRGYVRARDLLDTDTVAIVEQVVSIESNFETVRHNPTIITGKVIRVYESMKMRKVYDIQVEKNSNFFANNILVHNCGEIILRDRELCNLSEVVARSYDTVETLKKKIELAAIIGTIQSTLTKFRYVSSEWSKNCEEERLLGVSITGIMDNPILNKPSELLKDTLVELRNCVVNTNKTWAKKLGIESAKAVTACKPSGTVSALVNSASGIHSRWSPYYLRSVRVNKTESIAQFMISKGFPFEDDITNPDQTYVFSFPIASDMSTNGKIFRGERTAIEQLEFWKIYKTYWTDHNPSVTIYVKDHEWLEVGAWVYKNFDEICGLSFLPYTNHIYRQAPFIDCTKEEYDKVMEKMPKDVDWSLLSEFEHEDMTASSQEFACTGDSCELVEIGSIEK